MSFAELGLSTPLLRAVSERHYLTPTPVQALAIPAVLQGRDVWACAQTGSGKTAAFALPLLQALAAHPPQTPRPVRVLILVPTRELAAQIAEAIQRYAAHLPTTVKVVTALGGVSINPQMMALRGGAEIVVATPGRLLDLLDHNALSLAQIHTLVLDEADRLLDLGFSQELAQVLQRLPQDRQNLLFSATFPAVVRHLAEQLLKDPVRIDVASTPQTSPAIVQRSIAVDAPRRTHLLRQLIQQHGWKRVLVFVATRYTTEHLTQKLLRLNIRAGAFHGDLSQGARTQALADFKAQRLSVLVATDVAARGIDVPGITHVINFDAPRQAEDYVHRIGRTGRAGRTGIAVTLLNQDERGLMRTIERYTGNPIEVATIPGLEPRPRTERPRTEARRPAARKPGTSAGFGYERRAAEKRTPPARGAERAASFRR